MASYGGTERQPLLSGGRPPAYSARHPQYTPNIAPRYHTHIRNQADHHARYADSGNSVYALLRLVIICGAIIGGIALSPLLIRELVPHHDYDDARPPWITPCLKGPMLPPPRADGLRFNDPPWPGSVYVITEANTTQALTYYSDGSVGLTSYQRGTKHQRWTCRERDGWLAFTAEASDSVVFLGYSAWPSGPTMRCTATEEQFNEMFCVRKRSEDGFQVLMRRNNGLRPLGKDGGGTLAVVEVSDLWWGFSKV
ncbi:hypothetical protein H072_4977 [Dactylellina haptotyla CBS 200.50]|uniref:Ricin B lectin domain-containing protein n=1 Tax=Dactylellina haptotyla (strain CBS 200.50) TaxID=1284197 RepID=S8ADN1_DACHA|nr:hypothetical protein H072_4977 [Dactylellina haptotyla CBS 200.50]